MTNCESIDCFIPPHYAGMRLDQALALLWPAYSRSRVKDWIKAGYIQMDGHAARPRDAVLGGERIQAQLPQVQSVDAEPQRLSLTICYQDAHLIVIDKPAGLVVHPAAGNPDGTLLNGLLHYAPELAGLPRAGLIHRLDKDTSGLLVVARTLHAHRSLVAQLKERTVEREYQAVVTGVMTGGGSVNAPLGRHPVDRKRMAVVTAGKPALTHYRVKERFAYHTHIQVRLETGRTHQIRVHMAHIRYPIVGDPVYGGRSRHLNHLLHRCREALSQFPRQALHAVRLSVQHPETGEPMEWHSPVPADMSELLTLLRTNHE
jgi:23S rRNA pseudouridine1911/1915/1917 synthase